MSSWRKTESGIYLPDEVAGAWERVARNRYVAHVDMLGMKRLTLDNPRLAWSAVSDMVLALNFIKRLVYTIEGHEIRIADHVGSFAFSDTVLLFTRGDEEEDLRSIIFSCGELFARFLHRSLPFRIGVANGLFVFNLEEGLFVGPPLVEAYGLGEEAQWLGAVLDETVAKRAAELEPSLYDGKGLNLVVQWNVPLKSDSSVSRPVLAWPRSHRGNFCVDPPLSVEQFYEAFEQLSGPLSGLSSTVRAKYENTVAFVNAMLE